MIRSNGFSYLAANFVVINARKSSYQKVATVKGMWSAASTQASIKIRESVWELGFPAYPTKVARHRDNYWRAHVSSIQWQENITFFRLCTINSFESNTGNGKKVTQV
jgi:hypothetical protein